MHAMKDWRVVVPSALACLGIAAAFISWQGGKKDADSPSMLSSMSGMFTGPLDVLLFAGYGALYLACAVLGHYTREKSYSSTMFILISTLFKGVFAIGLWRAFDGNFADMLKMVREEYTTVLMYAVPSALYTLGDTLRTHVLRIVDPSTFLVLFNLRMFLLALVWERLLNRKLALPHWAALGLIFVGCSLKEVPNVNFSNLDSERCAAYLIILCIGGVNAFAAVANERLLKFQAQVPVNLQNLSMYTFGSMWAALATLIPLVLNSGKGESLLDAQQWRNVLLEPLILLMAVLVCILGITTGFFLKRLSNIHREVAVGVAMIASLPVDALLFGYSAGIVELCGIGVVLAGVLVFAANPVKAG